MSFKDIFTVLVNDKSLNTEQLSQEEIDFTYAIVSKAENITSLLSDYPDINPEQLSKYFLLLRSISYCAMYFD